MAQGQEPSFHWRVASKAWFAAWRFFERKTRDAVIFAGIMVVGGFTYYRLYGLPATREQIVPVLIFTVGPIVALWLFVFVWHLWLAPFAILYEETKVSQHRAAEQAGQATNPTIVLREIPPKPINWAPWRLREVLTLEQAACVLAKTDPQNGACTSDGKSYLALLIQQADIKKLKLTKRIETDSGHWTSKYSDVAKTELIRWAEQQNPIIPVDHIK